MTVISRNLELIKKMQFIDELEFSWGKYEYVYSVYLGQVVLWRPDTDTYLFRESYEGDTPDRHGAVHKAIVGRFLAAKIFRGKTFVEIAPTLTDVYLSYGCDPDGEGG